LDVDFFYDENEQPKKRKKRKGMNQNEFTMQNNSYMGFFGLMSSIFLPIIHVSSIFFTHHPYVIHFAG